MRLRLFAFFLLFLPISSQAQVALEPATGFAAGLDGNGFTFSASHGIAWTWQLVYFGTTSQNLFDPAKCPDASGSKMEANFSYPSFTETYLRKSNSIEQRFVISKPLELGGEDLLIEGNVLSSGQFIHDGGQWKWVTQSGEITLGDVTVFDQNGKRIPAAMSVNETGTSIVIDGNALASAAYPVTVDPEIGSNDFKISSQGSPGADTIDAIGAAVVYNSTNNEYLVVWSGDSVYSLKEIYGQRINAATGSLIGSPFQVSHMADSVFDCDQADVAWSSSSNRYLVVWRGDSAVDGEYEIWGQNVTNTGTLTGAKSFRVSSQGNQGSATIDAEGPRIAFNSSAGEFLVVWQGDTIAGEDEIYGQRINSGTGAKTGVNIRLTWHGPNGQTTYDAVEPDVVYNSANNEYVIVYNGDTVPGKDEIYAQRLAGATAMPAGSAVQASSMGTTGSTTIDAATPAVAWNSQTNQYMVVWMSDSDENLLVNGEQEVWGQRLSNLLAPLGTDDMRISDMGPDGNINFDIWDPDVVFSSVCQEYIVVWEGDDNTAPLIDNEWEVFLQIISSAGTEVGGDSVISDVGGTGNILFSAYNPRLAFNSTAGEYLIVFEGDDSIGGQLDEEFEIFGQRWSCTGGCVPPGASLDPVSDTICPGDNSMMSSGSTAGTDSVRWQVSVNSGATWSNVSNNSTYSDATTDTLTINNISPSMNGNVYRMLVYGCGFLADSSNAAQLIIDPINPTINCPQDTTVTPTTLDCNPAVNFNAATASDNCITVNVSYSQNSGSNFPVGTTAVTAFAVDSIGNQDSCTFQVTVNSPQLIGFITFNGDSVCSSPAATYQWFFNGVAIGGATNQCHIPQVNGTYHVVVTDTSGCQGESDTMFININSVIGWLEGDLVIYPNPAGDFFRVDWKNAGGQLVHLQIVDLGGRTVYDEGIPGAELSTRRIPVAILPSGVYSVKFMTESGTTVKQLLKE